LLAAAERWSPIADWPSAAQSERPVDAAVARATRFPEP
jgi:hypothetical protein